MRKVLGSGRLTPGYVPAAGTVVLIGMGWIDVAAAVEWMRGIVTLE